MRCPFSKYAPIILVVASFFMLGSCSSDSPTAPPEETFVRAGLKGKEINSFNYYEGRLYAATDQGLYRLKGNAWKKKGLQKKDVEDVVFLPGNRWLAGIQVEDFSQGIPSLYLSTNKGKSWEVRSGNYGGETGEYTYLSSLAAVSPLSDTLLAKSSGFMTARSTDGGETWNMILGGWDSLGGFGLMISPDPYRRGRIFAGGNGAFGNPYLLKSTDTGKTWEILEVFEGVAAICYDVAFFPENKDIILAGLGDAVPQARVIRKSTDGGQSWVTVKEGVDTFSLAPSARNPEVMYASGRNKDGTLFFMISGDFGESWQTIAMEDGPTDIRVFDMVSLEVKGREVLYLGTNKGVYSYWFKE